MARYEIDSNQFGPILSVRGRWDRSLEDVLIRQQINQIELWHSNGWRGKNLHFLERLPSLEGLYIWDTSGLDLSGIRFLLKLKRLNAKIWNKPSPPIAFENIKSLQSCKIEWNPAFESVLNCDWLKRLDISDMKKLPCLSLERLTNLQELWLTRASGLKRIILPSKNSLLEIFLRKLPALSEVVSWSHAARLTRLWLAECKRLDVSKLADASTIKVLDLYNMGSIHSLKFIRNLKSLENLTLSGSTKIEDGKLAFAIGSPALKTMTFPPHSHYDITPQKARELLMSK